MPDDTEKINEGMFEECNSLKNFRFPSKLKYIGAGAFMRVGLSEAILPEGVVRIDMNAFYGSESIKSMKLPQTLTNIGEAAFEDTGITKIILPEGLTEISDYLFSRNQQLESIYIPQAVQSIGKYAFWYCPLSNVYYGGTEIQWKQLIKDHEELSTLTPHYNSSALLATLSL